MEAVGTPTLRDYLIFLGMDNFSDFLREVRGYIERERQYKGAGDFFKEVKLKTHDRMKVIFDYDQIQKVCAMLDDHEKVINANTSIMHGDMVASNIFYNETTNEIKLIDPKGDLYGSFLYDLAKLNQTFTTPYDYIDGGLYVDDYVYKNHQKKYEDQWRDWLHKHCGEFVETIDVLTISLMCSLIPLHSDNPKNQKLYKDWCDDILL